MKKILILAKETDESVKMVVKHLTEAVVDFVILDTSKFPSEVGLSVSSDQDKYKGVLHLQDQSVSLDQIGVVWNRRIYKSEIDPLITDEAVAKWAQEESYYVIESFLSTIPREKWINPILPEEKIRFNKIIQANIAKKIGFNVPPSVITNISSVAEQFYELEKGNLIIKPLKTGLFDATDKSQKILYTSKVPDKIFKAGLDKIKFCPVFFQRLIQKKVELRITVVGESVFACAIDSQVNNITSVDWRKQMFLPDYLPHTPYDLPKEISTKCVNLVKRLGLSFGAIDMIITPDDKYVFLEINHNGQWGWVEITTGLPIAKAIANLLIYKCNHSKQA